MIAVEPDPSIVALQPAVRWAVPLNDLRRHRAAGGQLYRRRVIIPVR
jgi:hypothetical protein